MRRTGSFDKSISQVIYLNMPRLPYMFEISRVMATHVYKHACSVHSPPEGGGGFL